MNESDDVSEGIRRALRKKFEKRLPEKLNASSIYVDLSDISQIATNYLACIHELSAVDIEDNDAVQDIFIRIQIELYEHLPLHLKALEQHLEAMIDEFP